MEPKSIMSTRVMSKLVMLLVLGLASSIAVSAQSLSSRLSGHILLQVEDNGEAWYVNPSDLHRYYMKDGDVAYEMMRTFGLGITNNDLRGIPIGLDERIKGIDSDADGLIDQLEEGLGTNPFSHDSDNDGFSDYDEIESGFDPMGSGVIFQDNFLAERLAGNILLQVEQNGEAWYLNPQDKKRYYMKDGSSAYEIMRFLSLGITNIDLNDIPESKLEADIENNVGQSTGLPEINLASRARIQENSCTQLDFDMVFILLVDDIADATSNRTNLLDTIRLNFESAFLYATDGVATMNTGNTLVLIEASPEMVDTQYNQIVINEVTKAYYAAYDDTKDFIAIYDTILGNRGVQNSTPVSNNISGIGLDISDNRLEYFGDTQRLRSILNMGDIDKYLANDGNLGTLAEGLLHEVGHRWCCFQGDTYDGSGNEKLGIVEGSGHYINGLHSDHIAGGPLNSRYWESNGDSTYSRQDTFGSVPYTKYHPLTLYLMGVLDPLRYGISYPVYDAGVYPNFNFTSAPLYRTVSVSDIVSIEGPRQCE